MKRQSVHTLNYAQTIQWYRRSRTARWVVAMALVGTVAVASWHYGPFAWQYASMRYHLYTAGRFEWPKGMVIIEPDPERARALLQDSARYRPHPARPTVAVARDPAHLVGLDRFLDSRPHIATLFAHRRISESGEPKVVLVRIRDVTITSWSRNAPLVDCNNEIADVDLLHLWGDWTSMRIFAGEVDPQRANRLTIRYESADASQGGIIECWLRDGGLASTIIQGPVPAN